MIRIIISMTGIITCMNLMAQTPVCFYPQENAQDINIDTHLVIVFDKTVKTGSKGRNYPDAECVLLNCPSA